MSESKWIRSCCGQSHDGPVCPDNSFMCCLCFDKVKVEDAYNDGETKWDMCIPCGIKEEQYLEESVIEP